MANNNPQRERILARLRAATAADNAHHAARRPGSADCYIRNLSAITDPRERFLRECTTNLTEVVIDYHLCRKRRGLRTPICRRFPMENFSSRPQTSFATGLIG